MGKYVRRMASWHGEVDDLSVSHLGIFENTTPTRLDRRGPGEVAVTADGVEVEFRLSRLRRTMTTRPYRFSAPWSAIREWHVEHRRIAVTRHALSGFGDLPDLGIMMLFSSPGLAAACTHAAQELGLRL